MLKVFNGLDWDKIKQYKVWTGSQWITPGVHVRINGVWRQTVPPNAVILYNSQANAPAQSLICDGSNGTPNLLGKYINPNGAPLTLGGSNTHNGAEHGTNPVTAITSSSIGDARRDNGIGIYSGYGTYNNSWTHSHDRMEPPTSYTTWNHPEGNLHNDLVDVDHRPPSTSLVPTMLSPYMHNWATMMSYSDIPSAIRTLLQFNTMSASHIYMALTAVAGTATHTHREIQLVAIRRYAPTATNTPQDASWDDSHVHRIWHTESATNSPRSYLAWMYQFRPAVATDILYFDQLPQDSLVLFLSDDIPAGWEKVDFGEDLVLRGPSTGFTGTILGNNNHDTHTFNLTNQEHYGINARVRSTGGSTYTKYWRSSHSHTWTEAQHPDSVNIMPEWIGLPLARKMY
jgi:hypothetical protein